MTERQSSEITIYRLVSGSATAIVTVPITPESTRVFSLMSEDSITLSFNLLTPVDIQIGDYINDELFGKFYILDKQAPVFNEANGCYKYNLRFDAYYYLWKNKLFKLTALIDGVRKRKEVSWTLTDNLASHAQEIVNNLSVLGIKYGTQAFTYSILESATHASEAKCISYDGTDIISGIAEIARVFECEWWVAGNTIYFGKCEHGDEMVLSLEERTSGNSIIPANLFSITPQRNESNYANRIYFFGSTQNVPETYNKHLIFQVTNTYTEDGVSLFRDSNRKITKDMLAQGTINLESGFTATEFTGTVDTGSDYDGHRQPCTKETIQSDNIVIAKEGRYSFRLNPCEVSFVLFWYHPDGAPMMELTGKYYFKAILVGPNSFSEELFNTEGVATKMPSSILATETATTVKVAIPETTINYILSAGTYYIKIEVTRDATDFDFGFEVYLDEGELTKKGLIALTCYSTYADCPLFFNSTEYKVRFNPLMAEQSAEGFTKFAFVNNGTITAAPTGFGVGSEYTLGESNGATEGLEITKVPISFWTDNYSDPNSLLKIGENRLHLPLSVAPNGYLDGAGAENNDDIIEKSVILEDIFPKCTLRVSQIETKQRKNTEEHSDGSDTSWNWTQFILHATLPNGNTFPFRESFIKAGVTLQARFITPDEADDTTPTSAYKLAGMTFDILLGKDSSGNPTYTLKRNEDYGALLPNDSLCPEVGDSFILLGWDVRAISSLGLVAQAEQKLADVAEDYMDALAEDQLTFITRMFSDSAYSLTSLPTAGQKVRVKYGTIDRGTRILGYTVNLAQPFNTPEFTCGETEVYSRLKQIEKKLTQGGGSASGSITDSSNGAGGSSGSGGSQDLTNYITYDEANETYVRKDEMPDLDGYIKKEGTSSQFVKGDGSLDNNVYALKSEIGESYFDKVNIGTEQNPKYAIKVKEAFEGLFTLGFLTAGGIGSGGGGGGEIDLDRVWESLTNNTDKPNEKINIAHIPDITTSKVSDIETWIGNKGYLTSVKFSDLTSHPTTIEGYGITDAVDSARDLTDADDLLYVDPEEGEDVTIDDPGVTGTVLWGAESANQVALSVNGVSKTLVKYAAIEGLYSSIGTLAGYFSGGAARNALALEGYGASYFATASDVSALVTGVSSVVGQEGDVTVSQVATALTTAGYKLTDTIYILTAATTDTLGGIKIGAGLTIDGNGVVSVTGQTLGTVTRVDVGSSQYSPDGNGVVGLPAYPTTLPASDVYAWAKKSSLAASDVPNITTAKISDIETWISNKNYLTSVAFSDLTAHPTTIAEYGITDAKFGTAGSDYVPITLGATTVNVLTAHQSLSLYATKQYVDNAIEALPEPMIFKGSLGTGGTITTLPAASASNEGFTYKVITAGTYASQAAKIGDMFISTGTEWVLIPSGDEPSGTVTSVGMTVPTGLSVSGSPITTSGTLAVTFASGYSIPTTTKQSNWDTAYGWGDHSQAGYFAASSFTQSNIQSTLGISNWALAASKPSYSLSEISGTTDLQLIEAITGAGLLKRKSDNTWELDTNTYLTDYTIYALTIKNSAGTSVLSYNPKTAAGELTLTKAMVGLSSVDNTAAADYFTLLDNDSNQLSVTVGGTNKKLTIAYASNAGTLESHAASYFATADALGGVSGRVNTLEGYFTSGVANSAARLSGTSALNIWGVQYWANGVPNAVTGRPNLYIGTTQVQTSSAAQDLTGIGSISAAGALTLSTTKKIYFGDTDHFIELKDIGTVGSPNWVFHFSHGLYSNGFVTAGGVGSGSGGGGGIDLDRVWESLTNNTDKPNVKINVAHIPDLSSIYQPLDADLTAIAGLSGTSGYLKKTAADTWSLISGIPKTDLASAIQTSLGKADSAYQKPSGGIPKSDLSADLYMWLLYSSGDSYALLPSEVGTSSPICVNVTGTDEVYISGLGGYDGDTDNIDSASSVQTVINGKYVKPSGGIPATDLASAVQTSLGKADTAYQKPSGGIPNTDLALDMSWEYVGDSATYDSEDYIHPTVNS